MKSHDYVEAMKKIRVSEEVQNSILIKIKNSERSGNVMFKKRTVITVLAAALAIGATVFAAAGGITSWFSSSSSIPDYTKLPEAKQCVKDVGYEPVLIEKFANGYAFKDGSIVKNSLEDDSGKNVEKFKSFSFRYKKSKDELIFSQEKYKTVTENYGELKETVSGVDLYYSSYTNKFVPPDYKMTEEDKKAEKSGELVFTYGSDKAEIKKIQSLSWQKDGMHFSLMQIDGKLTADELVEMAKEIIE